MTIALLHDIVTELGVKVDVLESKLERMERKMDTDSEKTMVHEKPI